jgi:hypothetical protein
LILASDFSVNGNLFSVLRSSFDDGIALIRVLNADLCDIAVNTNQRFEAWQAAAHSSLVYLVNLSQAESHVLRTLPTDLLLCSSISEMTQFLFQMYTVESLLYKNVNHFLRYFPISMVSKFMGELKGLVNYLDLLQSSIAFRSRDRPLREVLVVYQRIESIQLYESIVGSVVIWRGFTSTSTDRDYARNHFITDENAFLFEIELHPGGMAIRIEEYSDSRSEREVLIAASPGLKLLSSHLLMFLLNWTMEGRFHSTCPW